jgi:hypothetical protein
MPGLFAQPGSASLGRGKVPGGAAPPPLRVMGTRKLRSSSRLAGAYVDTHENVREIS